jgi:hypothetical protein
MQRPFRQRNLEQRLFVRGQYAPGNAGQTARGGKLYRLLQKSTAVGRLPHLENLFSFEE